MFNPFRGIIAYYRIFNGSLRKGERVKLFNTGSEYSADEVGVLKLKMAPRDMMSTGDVGYIISGIKTSADVKVGDTITAIANPCKEAIAGFEDVKKPMVFAGLYPVETDQYEDLRASLEKLNLNDASLTYEPESSLALGFGFRCGFLGLLHMEIIQERLYREFNMDVITTVPNVSYKVHTSKGEVIDVHNPSGLPGTYADQFDRRALYSRSDHYESRVSRQRYQTLYRQAGNVAQPGFHHAGSCRGQFRHAAGRNRVRFLR